MLIKREEHCFNRYKYHISFLVKLCSSLTHNFHCSLFSITDLFIMVTLTHIQAVILCISALTTASPLSARTGKKAFSVKQIKVAATKTTNPAAHYAKVLRKYGAAVPDHVRAAAAATGTVTTTPTEYDSEYLTPIDVGGTTMNLDIDTGSSDL
jgi:aspergillopepsin I